MPPPPPLGREPMKHASWPGTVGIGLALLALLAAAPARAAEPFALLAEETGVVLEVPVGFTAGPGRNDPVLPYELTLVHAEHPIEARYAVRPIGRMTIDYNDPHNAAPEPEHLYPLMYAALVDQLAVSGSDVRREYPPEQARERFGADWAAAALFDVRAEFAGSYRQAMLLALHRQKRGEVYTVVLFDDPQPVREALDQALAAVRFVE